MFEARLGGLPDLLCVSGKTLEVHSDKQVVEGVVRNLDTVSGKLTLDDGTRLTIPPTVQLPGAIKEGSIVKASFEEHAGEKMVTSLEIQTP